MSYIVLQRKNVGVIIFLYLMCNTCVFAQYTKFKKEEYIPPKPTLIQSPKTFEDKLNNFNQLRGHAKKIKLVWGTPTDKARLYTYGIPYKIEDLFVLKEHLVTQKEDIDRWRKALESEILLTYTATTVFVSGGIGGDHYLRLDVNGIIAETDYGEVYIGISHYGFHFDHWKGCSPPTAFYSPSLATMLEEYTNKMKLEGYPKWHYTELSGENMIQLINRIKNDERPVDDSL